MMKRHLMVGLIGVLLGLPVWSVAQSTELAGEDDAVRSTIRHFELALAEKSIAEIEAVVASDLVVLENGHRNDGWTDFRDNHLIPELKEPSKINKSEMIKLRTTSEMAWAYTRSEMKLSGGSGRRLDGILWSAYVLERRAGKWKIVLLDWSLRVVKGSRG
ncbi:MAG TPA: hypothetical protein VN577_08400 [Terriglobales bacterium]|nr:hypothetical protein [Terriglobales bacterium]